MSHLWVSVGQPARHFRLFLDAAELALPVPLPGETEPAAPTVAIVRLESEPRETWALLVAGTDSVLINGTGVPAGLTVLEDRDEIRMGAAAPYWFSTESITCVEPAPARPGRSLACARCQDPIEAGSAAVRCAHCGVWHHEAAPLLCFTYQSAPCAACRRHSQIGGEFQFSPEEL